MTTEILVSIGNQFYNSLLTHFLLESRFLSEYRFDVSKLEPLVAKVSPLINMLLLSDVVTMFLN